MQEGLAPETRREILAGIFLNSEMKKLLSLAITCISLTSFAQTGSEIIVFDLKIKKNKVTISNPKNITNHPGYDNQPFFHPDRQFIYFSSFNDEGRSDIKRYSLSDDTVVNITNTPEREYSPTVTPDKQFLSCIIQRDNGAQDLGKYPVDGGEPALIIDSVLVGYHVWLDNSHIGLFILGGEGKPNDFHFMRLPTKEDTVIATNIGRSLHKVPRERSISFIQNGENDNSIMKYNIDTRKVSEITKTMNKGQDIAWTLDGKIITSDGTKLYWIDGKRPKTWAPVEITKGAELLKSVTRIAVNADGSKIAVVVAE